ncbi:hypothetical protein ACTD5D_40085 [Nocardia takedensis]|uniref:hypothetical protein n=1 Tax=Nocardia takedensis TaxID=259390 RepID=UPI003F76F1CD
MGVELLILIAVAAAAVSVNVAIAVTAPGPGERGRRVRGRWCDEVVAEPRVHRDTAEAPR